MNSPLGAAAALASSGTWAYASARYAVASREVSPVRVNWFRMASTLPAWLALALVQGGSFAGLRAGTIGWIALSTVCSYALGDNLFLAAAKRLGVASALSIASSYPLWAALKGTLLDGEPFGPSRALGTLLCVGGVATIIKLGEQPGDREATTLTARSRGLALALATSVLWAGNTIGLKAAAQDVTLATVNVVRHTLALSALSIAILLGRAPGKSAPSRGWKSLLLPVVLDNLIGSYAFIYGLAHTDLAVGATLSSLAPLLSLPIAFALKAEKITPAKLGAVATTVAGIVLLSL